MSAPIEAQIALAQLRIRRDVLQAEMDAIARESANLERMAAQPAAANSDAHASDEPHWTAADVARYIGGDASENFVYDQTKAAVDPLPCHQIGRLKRFSPSAVRAWMARHRVDDTQLLAQVVSLQKAR